MLPGALAAPVADGAGQTRHGPGVLGAGHFGGWRSGAGRAEERIMYLRLRFQARRQASYTF